MLGPGRSNTLGNRWLLIARPRLSPIEPKIEYHVKLCSALEEAAVALHDLIKSSAEITVATAKSACIGSVMGTKSAVSVMKTKGLAWLRILEVLTMLRFDPYRFTVLQNQP